LNLLHERANDVQRFVRFLKGKVAWHSESIHGNESVDIVGMSLICMSPQVKEVLQSSGLQNSLCYTSLTFFRSTYVKLFVDLLIRKFIAND
jgi:hypothetical protein